MDKDPKKGNARNVAKHRALMKLKAEHPERYRVLYLRELTPLFEELERKEAAI